MFLGVNSVNVKVKYAAVLSADGAGKNLQLYRVLIPEGAISSKVCLDDRNNGVNIVGVKIEGTGGTE